MKSVVGTRGQVVIPKPLRDRLGIRPGQRLEFEERGGRLVARKAADDDPIAAAYGSLRLPRSVDELIEEMRGPAELPANDDHRGRHQRPA